VTQLSRWIESKKLSAERLTNIYLSRIERLDSKIRSIITLTRDHALARAQQADAEIAAGKYRGPLHGIPYGVKDLLDTKDIATTYGAEPFRNRVPSADSFVVRRLNDAGRGDDRQAFPGRAGAERYLVRRADDESMAFGRRRFGIECRPRRGHCRSAGRIFNWQRDWRQHRQSRHALWPNRIATNVWRVARTGAMTLCWSLDKLGPMTRSVEDAMLVLQAISGADAGDASSVPSKLDFDASKSVAGLKIGYVAQWMKEAPATDVDRAAMETMKKLGMELKEVTLPDWPYSSLMPILFAEGAASFEDLALNNQLGELKVQVKDAWPNLFRQARFLSAVDLVQADRLRRKVANEMARVFHQVDLLLVPSLRDEQLTITNFTGHPSLTFRAGFVEVSEARSDWAPDPASPLPKFNPPRRVPHGITILGRLFDDGLLGQVGIALEREFAVWKERPAGF
jgi:Asp-tRNA(Asn)/Glu-tRNA(Gln) amidotransferase A subunit family amidase